MFNWKEFEKSQNILSHVGGTRYHSSLGQHHLRVRPNELQDWMEFLKEDLGFLTLADMVTTRQDDHLEVVYHLLNMGSHLRLNLHLDIFPGEIVPSVEKFFSHAEWPEREQAELFPLAFETKKYSLLSDQNEKAFEFPERRYNPNKSEAPYPEESYVWKKYDLLSPVTEGNFEWMVCFDPLRVVDSKLRIGFHHQGLEKLFEKKDILQIMQLADKVNLSSAPNYSVAWAKTVEEMFRIKIPERAQAIRIVMLELARISDHLTVLTSVCHLAGQNEFKLFLNAREKVYELFEKFVGFRTGLGVARLGGVREDLPAGWIIEYQRVAEVLIKNLRVIHNSLLSQVKFRDFLDGEPLNAQSVLQWGITGPAMRAAGLNFDLRKSQPFYFYQDIDFDIPVGIHGTAFDRYLIRYEEIFQSLRIITQVIDNLPLGETINPLFDKNYLETISVLNTLEAPTEWHYSAIESPTGEAGFLVELNRDLKPKRLKLKTPGFFLAQALGIFVKGLREDQLSTSIASLGLSRWEMDR